MTTHIPELPETPLPSQNQPDFNALAEAFLLALIPWRIAANTLGDEMEALAGGAGGSAADAEAAADRAEDAEAAAELARDEIRSAYSENGVIGRPSTETLVTSTSSSTATTYRYNEVIDLDYVVESIDLWSTSSSAKTAYLKRFGPNGIQIGPDIPIAITSGVGLKSIVVSGMSGLAGERLGFYNPASTIGRVFAIGGNGRELLVSAAGNVTTISNDTLPNTTLLFQVRFNLKKKVISATSFNEVRDASLGETRPDFIGVRGYEVGPNGKIVSAMNWMGVDVTNTAITSITNDTGGKIFSYVNDPAAFYIVSLSVSEMSNVLHCVPTYTIDQNIDLGEIPFNGFGPYAVAEDFEVYPDGMEPMPASLEDGTDYVCVVGSSPTGRGADLLSPLYVSEMHCGFGRARNMIGRCIDVYDWEGDGGPISGDDHNQPRPLVDPRPSAAWPLMVFQTDHGRARCRVWQSSTGRVEDLVATADMPAGSSEKTYPTPFRNPNSPDTIWVQIRSIGGSGQGNWRWVSSIDNGANWTQPTGTMLAAPGLYPNSGSPIDAGLPLVFSKSGTVGGGGSISIGMLKWDKSFVSWGAGGEIVISSDLFAVSTPINPLTDVNMKTVYTAPANFTATHAQMVYADTTKIVTSAVVMNPGNGESTSKLILITYDIATDTATSEEVAPSGGFYTAEKVCHSAFFSTTSCVIARWWTSDNFGEIVRVDKVGGVWKETILRRLNARKIIRPRFSVVYWWDNDNSKLNNYNSPRVFFTVGAGKDGGFTNGVRFNSDAWSIDYRKGYSA